MLVFPLVIAQFFSSGLIMVGEIVREVLALTIGRDLRRTETVTNHSFERMKRGKTDANDISQNSSVKGHEASSKFI